VLARTVAARPPRVKATHFWYNTGMAPTNRIKPLRLESLPGRMPAIEAAGFALGAALLVAARFVPQLVSPLAFWLLAAALAAGFGVDLLLWISRGVRAIELDGDTLALRRGRGRTVQRIERASVVGVRSRRSWGGRAIELILRGAGGPSVARLARQLLRRDRVVLKDDAFDREAFARLAGLLSTWGG
jgi:hypothetical protein